mmetsp:Transcript_333/g.495  ORF Transcript_333/g.495 Transcript_333/m.495 type:complete len:83 (-) Transcript_333:218-466(-)
MLDGIDFDLFCMKEPGYVMIMMSTYGTLEYPGSPKYRSWLDDGEKKQAMIRYPEVIHNHYLYQHVVDNHNGLRHAPISLEMS